MGTKQVRAVCELSAAAERLLERAMWQQDLTARAHDRIMEVARRVADLDAQQAITVGRIAEAIQYHPSREALSLFSIRAAEDSRLEAIPGEATRSGLDQREFCNRKSFEPPPSGAGGVPRPLDGSTATLARLAASCDGVLLIRETRRM